MQNFISVSTIFCKIICKFIEITLMQVCGWVWWWTKALSEISPLINCSNNIQISSLNIHSVCINPCTSSKRPSLASSFSLKIRWVSPNLWVGCWRWEASLPFFKLGNISWMVLPYFVCHSTQYSKEMHNFMKKKTCDN